MNNLGWGTVVIVMSIVGLVVLNSQGALEWYWELIIIQFWMVVVVVPVAGIAVVVQRWLLSWKQRREIKKRMERWELSDD